MDIFKMSIAASILIVFTAIVRFLFKKMISKNTVMLLWGIVCCKLMIPVSVFHLNGLTFFGEKTFTSPVTGWIDVPAGFYQAALTRKNFNIPAFQLIWSLGMVVMALYFIWNYLRCLHMFQISLPMEESSSVTRLHEKRCGYRKVKIRISDRITSPLTYGIFHPVILLPKNMDWDNKEHMCYVLKHELAHIKRFDALWKICLAAVLVCHWFNPLVWGMYFYANQDIELACDENVIRKLSRKQCSAYAIMLAEWSAQKSDGNPMVSYLMHNFIEERIINIMKKRKLGIAGIMLSMALLAGAATVYAAIPATVQTAAVNQQAEDLTLGGIFELYTPEEYEQMVVSHL